MTQYVKISGVDDMVLLSKVTDDAIVENLQKRFSDGYIFTCIGPVLVSVNPFKQMPYFGEKEIQMYQGAAPYENPPHIYGLADEMYRNMLIDVESQCVIISGESGAGKTVAAKYIMSYISKISGGGKKVQKIKDIIMESNPLLEAFGNAKTIRNNNSSRFGKYVQIQFGDGGQPLGCKISNFLLEKSRVVQHSSRERNFHIFYQLIAGADEQMKSNYRLGNELNQCDYLKTSDRGNNSDAKDFQETLQALTLMDFKGVDKYEIVEIVAGILHIGNIKFQENGNYSQIANERIVKYVANIFEINANRLAQKLTSREFESKWGSTSESVDVTLNVSQALYARDALAKDIYARLFDYLVKQINLIMEVKCDSLEVGILDIYGFEIFDKNSFEQFCINYVNEKLQQIFIELTLKAEQDEYVAEHIKWTPIEYFNNAVVVDLLEDKKLPGLFLILDDVCATLHGGITNADSGLKKKLSSVAQSHKHFEETRDGFLITHYAGQVMYNVDGFCDKNRDVLFTDLIELMQTSSNKLVKALYLSEKTQGNTQSNTKTHKFNRPTTAGSKIRNQASRLVSHLTKCTPHYIRCIKPNDLKKAYNWDGLRVKHQVEYLGLKENIRVRRAGFVYRRPFSKFLHRYSILTRQIWPVMQGDEKQSIKVIMASNNVTENQYQLGITKIFIKAPETLFMLEEARDRKYNYYARVIQKAFKKYFTKKRQISEKQLASDLLYGHKQRRQQSLNRNYYGDYIGIDIRPGIARLFERREKILFAETVKKYDRRFKVTRRDLVLTDKYLYLIGRSSDQENNKTIWKRKIQRPSDNKKLKYEVIKRKLTLDDITHISMSSMQDDFIIIHVKDDYATLLQVAFKTEFVYQLSKKYTQYKGHSLNIKYSNNLEFRVKKEGWGGGGTRQVKFTQNGFGNDEIIKVNGKILNVSIGPGLPATTKPNKFDNVNEGRKTTATAINYGNICESIMNNRVNNVNNVNNRVPLPPSHPAPVNQPIIRPPHQQTAHHYYSTIDNHYSNDVNANDRLKAPQKKPPPPPISKLKKAKALFSYSPQDLDELELKEDDIVEILKEYDGGWWYGRLKGKIGLFPSNYVEKL